MGEVIQAKVEDVMKILDVFSSPEEVNSFVDSLCRCLEFISSMSSCIPSESPEEVLERACSMQLFAFSVFLQRNMDVINSMVSSVQYKVVDSSALGFTMPTFT